MIIGIDAHNIRGNGGSVVHLRELLANADPQKNGFISIVVWTNEETLKVLPKSDFINYILPNIRNSLLGLFWQKINLEREAKKLNVDILFIPGGIYLGNFRPFIALSQSMLPFDQKARNLYRGTLLYWILGFKKLLMLKTFRNSNGIIFVSNAIKKQVEKVNEKEYENAKVIHHGVNEFFKGEGKRQKAKNRTIRLLTVASHALHKNLIPLVRKISELRIEGFDLSLQIVGPETKYGSKELYTTIKRVDPQNEFVKVITIASYDELPIYYDKADIFIASSLCESFGLPLKEALVNGMAILYQDLEPFNEIISAFNSEIKYKKYKNLEEDFKNKLLDLIYTDKIYPFVKIDKRYFWEESSDITFLYLKNIIHAK